MYRHVTTLLFGFLWLLPASADELVYEPINPAFGGLPDNGIWLLDKAQAQNDFERDSAARAFEEQSALDRFNDLLERAILSRLASEVTGNLFTEEGALQPGTSIETADFIIEIVDLGDGTLEIVTTDKLTGDSTSFVLASTLNL